MLDSHRGVVARARPARGGDEVAVVFLDPAGEPVLPKRFDRQRRSLLRLSERTDGIVSLLDHGLAPDGRPYIVVPYHPIGSLQDQLERGPTPWYPATRLVSRAAEIAGRIHAEEIVLGDLRPTKVLLATVDRPLISAFGMATRRFDDGQPDYRAPEAGNDRVATSAADVYSLSLILGALVTGRPKEPAEPLDQFLARVNEHLPDRLREVVEHGLAVSPLNRPRTGSTLHRALEQALEAGPSGMPTATDGAPVDLEHLLDDDLTIDPADAGMPPLDPDDPELDGSLASSAEALPPGLEDIVFVDRSTAVDAVTANGHDRQQPWHLDGAETLPPEIEATISLDHDDPRIDDGDRANDAAWGFGSLDGPGDITSLWPVFELGNDDTDPFVLEPERSSGHRPRSEPTPRDSDPGAETGLDRPSGPATADEGADTDESATLEQATELEEAIQTQQTIDTEETIDTELSSDADSTDAATSAASDATASDDAATSDTAGTDATASDDDSDDDANDVDSAATDATTSDHDSDDDTDDDTGDVERMAEPTVTNGVSASPVHATAPTENREVVDLSELFARTQEFVVPGRSDPRRSFAASPADASTEAVDPPAPSSTNGAVAPPDPVDDPVDEDDHRPEPPRMPLRAAEASAGDVADEDPTDIFPGLDHDPVPIEVVPVGPGGTRTLADLAAHDMAWADRPVRHRRHNSDLDWPSAVRVRLELMWFRGRRNAATTAAVLGLLAIAAAVVFIAAQEIRSGGTAIQTDGAPEAPPPPPAPPAPTTSIPARSGFAAGDTPYITDVPLPLTEPSEPTPGRPPVVAAPTTSRSATTAATVVPTVPNTEVTPPTSPSTSTTEPPTSSQPPTTPTSVATSPPTVTTPSITVPSTSGEVTTTRKRTTTTRPTSTGPSSTDDEVVPPIGGVAARFGSAGPTLLGPDVQSLTRRTASLSYSSSSCVATRFQLRGTDGSTQSGTSDAYDPRVACSHSWNLDFRGSSRLRPSTTYTLTVWVKDASGQTGSGRVSFTTPG